MVVGQPRHGLLVQQCNHPSLTVPQQRHGVACLGRMDRPLISILLLITIYGHINLDSTPVQWIVLLSTAT